MPNDLEGPVRAVAFHPSRALLVTGGDDYKIKVWGEYDGLVGFRPLIVSRHPAYEPPLPLYAAWAS